jgi:hypothetical protein
MVEEVERGAGISTPTAALGAIGQSFAGGDGGGGGSATVAPTMGLAGGSSGGSKGGGGGGGGAVGHIRLRSLEACSINGALITPTTNTACPL